ncbi:MAG: acyl-CoA thioesterase [Gemmatimonadetes bacterium]|nr:acyl-CoA thioesterase [Gemmatimonadota bacterium]
MAATHTDPFAGRQARRHEKRFRVLEEDIDHLGHVNNVVYVGWVQEVAGEHWRTTADPELADRVAWVLTRHEIDYKRPAHLGDEVIARTWVGEASPVRFERHVEILDRDDRLLARSRTIWCPIDRDTGRVTRLDASAHDPFYEP